MPMLSASRSLLIRRKFVPCTDWMITNNLLLVISIGLFPRHQQAQNCPHLPFKCVIFIFSIWMSGTASNLDDDVHPVSDGFLLYLQYFSNLSNVFHPFYALVRFFSLLDDCFRFLRCLLIITSSFQVIYHIAEKGTLFDFLI